MRTSRAGAVLALIVTLLAFAYPTPPPAAAGQPVMVEAVEIATGRPFMMAPPTNCPMPSGVTVVCLFANAQDPNTARWYTTDEEGKGVRAGVPVCVKVGNDQFGQSMNNRASYVITRSPFVSNYGWHLWDYTTCGYYNSDVSLYMGPNVYEDITGCCWDNIVGSVKLFR